MWTWRGNFRASILSSEDLDRTEALSILPGGKYLLAVNKDYLDSPEKNNRMISIKRKKKLSVES